VNPLTREEGLDFFSEDFTCMFPVQSYNFLDITEINTTAACHSAVCCCTIDYIYKKERWAVKDDVTENVLSQSLNGQCITSLLEM